MGQSLAQIYLHVVFSTKGRAPYLNDKALQKKVHGYLAGACHNLECPSIFVGGVEDHVHILCRLSKTQSPAVLVRELKRESSRWIKAELGIRPFSWQAGYGAFSISPGHVEALKKYIVNQESHHRRESFQDEFRRLLRKYGLEYDERYAWD
jgi:REP element-mobilizing transposase RayT